MRLPTVILFNSTSAETLLVEGRQGLRSVDRVEAIYAAAGLEIKPDTKEHA